MPATDAIKITGLRDLQAALKQMDGEAQKQLRGVLNEAAEIVVSGARAGFPTKTGRAKGTIKVMSSQREARVKEGSAKAPYAPWLDYGGRVGPKRSVSRPFVKTGRYVYPAYNRSRDDILDALSAALAELITRAGLEVG